uniref:uncharacterized protein LOC122592753 n=1 Tax=Erigeron canadensis TaxID=72917 RepID=UPI001CB992EE|nr:uncharacterized protein LOC122592753 [Erigeron canadensis]
MADINPIADINQQNNEDFNDNSSDHSFYPTQISKLDFGDPLYLHASDTSGTPLINFKLKGTENYKVWACAMTLALETKNKVGFIDGSVVKNEEDEILSKQWDRCNSVVLSWILSSLNEEVYMSQIFSKHANLVWEELKETYDKVDGSIIFNLHHSIHSLTQNGTPLSEYYHKLNSLWKQYDALVHLPTCVCNATKEIKSHTQVMKLMQFLMGLDDEYIPIRSTLLTREPLPTVKVAFAIMSREESHRGTTVRDSRQKPQASAFVSKSFETKRPFSRPTFNKGSNSEMKCTKCNRTGHTIDKCFEIHGVPSHYNNPNFKRNSGVHQNTSRYTIPQNRFFNEQNRFSSDTYGNRRFSNNSMVPETVQPNFNSPSSSSQIINPSSMQFTPDQFSQILSLLNERNGSQKTQANMAGTIQNSNHFFNQNFNRFYCATVHIKHDKESLGWVVDYGANSHMVCTENDLIDPIDITSLNLTVGHPNGTNAKIIKIGNLKISDEITIFDALFVPEYCVNLLSVHKLAKDSKLFIGFDEDKCYIQDLRTKKVLGTGSESGCLYLFDSHRKGRSFVLSNNTLGNTCSTNIWHNRLGHPADQVLNVLKLKLDNSSPCEVCLKAKHVREPFPLSDHTSKAIGDLVHIDLWGPYRVTSREGYKLFLTIVDDFSRAVWVYILKTKAETFDNLMNFYNLLHTQFNVRVLGLKELNLSKKDCICQAGYS